MSIYQFLLGFISLLCLPCSGSFQFVYPGEQVCLGWSSSQQRLNLNLNTSLIRGTNGSCACKISFGVAAQIVMYFNKVYSPQCSTKIILSDESFTLTCINDFYVHSSDSNLKQVSYAKHVVPGEPLWMFIKTNGDSQMPMSGIVQVVIDDDKQFNLECFEPNKNSSSTTEYTSTRLWSYTTTTIRENVTELALSNETNEDATSYEFPVVLIAGCATGGVVLIGLIALTVFCCRRKTREHSTPSIDGRTDDYLCMENDLYQSCSEMSMSQESNRVEAIGVESDKASNGSHVKKKTSVIVPNGDVYNIVDRSIIIKDFSQREVHHSTAPSGDVYAVVEKSG